MEHSNKDLQNFPYLASHDLREPLLKILIFSDRIQEAINEGRVQNNDYLERVQNAALQMQHVIDGILEFSEVAIKIKPFKPTNLGESVSRVSGGLEE